MALRPLYGWIAVALGALLAGSRPGIAQAAPVPEFKQLAVQAFVEPAAFRTPGPAIGRFRITPRGSRVRPRGPSRQLLNRHPKGGRRTGTNGLAGGGATGAANVTGTGTGSRQPAGGGTTGLAGVNGTGRDPVPFPRHPPEGGLGLIIVPVIPIAGGTFAILGSGGSLGRLSLHTTQILRGKIQPGPPPLFSTTSGTGQGNFWPRLAKMPPKASSRTWPAITKPKLRKLASPM